MRRKIFGFIIIKIAKVPEGQIIPKWLRIIRYILFPYESLLLTNKYMNYDMCRDVFIIYGQEYSGAYFRAVAESQINQCFRIIDRESGMVTIRHIKDCPKDCI